MPVIEIIAKTFAYDPETGALTYREPRGTLPAGRPAGTPVRGGIRVMTSAGPVFAHRIIWHLMTGEWPRHPVRHINGDKTDNRWSNLEVRLPVRLRDPVTRKPVKRRFNQTVAHGITRRSFEKLNKVMWEANALHAGERVFLGRFETEEEARAAFRAATGQEIVPGDI